MGGDRDREFLRRARRPGRRSGAVFAKEDDTPGTAAAVVLSHAYWQRRFNGDPSVIGRQVRINAQPFTIVGVAGTGILWRGLGSQLRHVVADRHAADRDARRQSPGGPRQPLARDDWTAVAGSDARAGAGRAGFDPRRHAHGVCEPEPLHRSSRRRLPDGQLAGWRHRGAAARPADPDRGGRGGPVDHVREPRRPAAGPRVFRASGKLPSACRWAPAGGASCSNCSSKAPCSPDSAPSPSLVALRWTSGLLIGFAPPSELPIHLAVSVDANVVWFTAAVAIGTVLLFALAPAAQAAPADVATTLREIRARRAARSGAIGCAARWSRRRWRSRSRCWSVRASACAA